VSRTGAWAPTGSGEPNWGVSLHETPAGAAGHYFGRAHGNPVFAEQRWYVLTPDNVVWFQHANGAFAEERGEWNAVLNDNGTLNFTMRVPAAWGGAPMISPPPPDHQIFAVMSRVA